MQTPSWIGMILLTTTLLSCSSPTPPTPPPPATTAPTPKPTPPKPPPPAEVHFEATPDWREPSFPYLPEEDRTDSISLGTVTHGFLVNAKPLPLPGQHYRVLLHTRERGLLHSSQEMIGLLQRVSHKLNAATGRRLSIGNLGQRGGGDISHSVSHNSGRDADISFCYETRKGKPFEPRELIPLDRKGVSRWKGGHRFDAACTWAIVRALLQDDQVQLQHLFLSDSLRKLLLDHARTTKEPPALLQRAAQMITQPSKADAHHDHLHVRLYCTQKDVLRGCKNNGRTLPNTKTYEDALKQEITSKTSNLQTQINANQRILTLKRLALLRPDHDALKALLPTLKDPSQEVRIQAIRLLADQGSPAQRLALLNTFEQETPPVKAALLQTLVKHPTPRLEQLLVSVLEDPASHQPLKRPLPDAIRLTYTTPTITHKLASHPTRKAMSPIAEIAFSGLELPLSDETWTLRLAAVEASAHCACRGPVNALVKLLDQPNILLRARAARALRRLTNHRARVNWANPTLSKRAKARGITYWTTWAEKEGRKSRETWLVAGFRTKKYKVHKLSGRFSWELVRAISSHDHLSFNAQRSLMKITRHQPDSLSWSKPRATRYWTRWLERRRRELHLPPCPDEKLPCRRK